MSSPHGPRLSGLSLLPFPTLVLNKFTLLSTLALRSAVLEAKGTTLINLCGGKTLRWTHSCDGRSSYKLLPIITGSLVPRKDDSRTLQFQQCTFQTSHAPIEAVVITDLTAISAHPTVGPPIRLSRLSSLFRLLILCCRKYKVYCSIYDFRRFALYSYVHAIIPTHFLPKLRS